MVDNSGVSILFSNHVSFDDGEPIENDVKKGDISELSELKYKLRIFGIKESNETLKKKINAIII